MEILEDYYMSKLALDILTKEVEEKKQAVAEFLLTLSENKAEIPGAKFHIKKEFTYEFSDKAILLEEKTNEMVLGIKDKIKSLQKGVKNVQAIEIEDGTAQLTDTKYIPVMTLKK